MSTKSIIQYILKVFPLWESAFLTNLSKLGASWVHVSLLTGQLKTVQYKSKSHKSKNVLWLSVQHGAFF